MSDDLRDEHLELRAEERQLEAVANEIAAELAANRARQAHVKALLQAASRSAMRVPVSTPRSARGTLSRLGTFTESEALAALGWKRPQLRQLFEVMMCEKPPALKEVGRAMGKPVFRYTGPPIAGDPVAERQAAAMEAVSGWVALQDPGRTITPGTAAAGANVDRVDAGLALAQLARVGDTLEDVSPARDRPMFRRAGDPVNGRAAPAPPPFDSFRPETTRPRSKVPAIDELLDIADQAGFSITEGAGHFAIEALDGARRVVKTTFEGTDQYRHHKAWLRRNGARI